MLKDLRGESVLAVGHQPWLSELGLHRDLNPAGMRLMALWPPEPAP
jgi:hypothetical protein